MDLCVFVVKSPKLVATINLKCIFMSSLYTINPKKIMGYNMIDKNLIGLSN